MGVKLIVDPEDWYSPKDFIKNADKLCKLILVINRLNDVYDVKVELTKLQTSARKLNR